MTSLVNSKEQLSFPQTQQAGFKWTVFRYAGASQSRRSLRFLGSNSLVCSNVCLPLNIWYKFPNGVIQLRNHSWYNRRLEARSAVWKQNQARVYIQGNHVASPSAAQWIPLWKNFSKESVYYEINPPPSVETTSNLGTIHFIAKIGTLYIRYNGQMIFW